MTKERYKYERSKGLNTWGKDVFNFVIENGEIYPGGYNANSTTSCFSHGWNCTNWVIQNENMDYLKADSTGKCKNSSIVLDGTTNTTCH